MLYFIFFSFPKFRHPSDWLHQVKCDFIDHGVSYGTGSAVSVV
jgi:hypothetical protein